MGFRIDTRLPASTAEFSTTSTTLATLTVEAVAGKRICITGYSVMYATPFTTAVQPHLLTGGVALVTLANTLTTASGTFASPVCGAVGANVILRTTVSSVSVVNMSLAYYYDD